MNVSLDCLSKIKCSLAIVDGTGRILCCNAGFEQGMGTAQSDLIDGYIQDTPLYNGQLAGSFTEEWIYMQEIHKKFYVVHFMPIEDDPHQKFGLLTITPSDTLIKSQKDATPECLIPKELQSIFDLSYDGLFITDGGGRILMVNTSWEKLTGFFRSEVLGRRANDLVKEGKYSRSVAELVLETGQTETILLEITDGERAQQKILATGVPIFDAKGEVWRVVANIRDIAVLNQIKTHLEEQQITQTEEKIQPMEERVAVTVTPPPEVIVKSEAMRRTMDMVSRVARTDATVLLSGETGVGKDVAARLLHKLSPRGDQPYIQLNCAAIPGSLLESELFGYASGAFTGAKRGGKTGLFEMAHGGTLLLDEIGEMPFDLQAKILRALQSKEYYKVGASKAKVADVRIIAATNRDLKQMVGENQFRADLFFRLCVMNIVIPPLRERKEEIPHLVRHFLKVFNQKHGRAIRLEESIMPLLLRYEWPGNVRELENLMERLVILGDDTISPSHLPQEFWTGGGSHAAGVGLRKSLDEVEYEILKQAAGTYQSTRKLAKALGVSQSTVIRKLKYHHITAD